MSTDAHPETRATRSIPAQVPPPQLPQLTYPGQAVCRYCKTPLSREKAGSEFCGSSTCETRRVQAAARALEKQKWDDYVQEQIDAVQNAGDELVAAADALGGTIEDLPIGVVPRQSEPVVPLPDWRRDAFREHLEKVVAESFEREVPEGAMDGRTSCESDETDLIDATCGTCWGHCCVLGGHSHAFLSRVTIDVHRSHRPDRTADEIIDYYLGKIPEETTRHSCVYHGPQGCTLDRPLRSTICNSFHCLQQTKLYERWKETGKDRAVIIANRPNHKPRVAIYDAENGHRLLDTNSAPNGQKPERAVALAEIATAQVPKKLPESHNLPEYGPDRSCKWCGAPIDVHRAATGQSCGASFCEQRRLRALYGDGN
ncbi:MAG: hypothetical protein AAF666_06605 [Pseudomonadota bacterium]